MLSCYSFWVRDRYGLSSPNLLCNGHLGNYNTISHTKCCCPKCNWCLR
ncbi:unnamed protein product [Larinioides sclopetarius]|uniref:Uncharacterized protein n=1 Tax=Larinioides sclopetarius TaxID=280406 RepID=A0AAV2B9V1_9ARAC